MERGARLADRPFATAARAKALTDFVGIAIHCGAGGGICDDNANAKPDSSPTSRAATRASRACSARSTSTRRSTAAACP